jgi:RNA polymerase sigma-70 factor (ECF subfamily)
MAVQHTGTNVPSCCKSQQKVQPTDNELLVGMLAGDEDAFTALYRRRQGPVYRFALQMTGNVVIAEDVTQEVFMALLSKTAKYDPARGTLASFLYGVARNLVLRRIEKTAEIEDYAGPEDILGDLTRRETIENVRRAVLSLPPVYREAVVLCDIHDTSYEEAALALDCPIGTVRSRLNRGRSMLAQKLAVRSSV